MARYKKSFQTEESTYSAAKELFFQKGYTATTVKDICEKAGIKLGTFTYHYKGKDTLAVSIYQDFIDQLTEQVYSVLDSVQPKIDPFTREIATYRAYFSILNSSSELKRFYCEICSTEVFRDVNYQMNETFVRNVLNNFTKNGSDMFYSENEINFPLTVTLICGMEIRFMQDLFSEKFVQQNAEDSIDYFLLIFFSIFCRNRNEIHQHIQTSKSFLPLLQHLYFT